MFTIEVLAVLMVMLPLFAAAVVGLSSLCISDRMAQIITSGSVIISALCATSIFHTVTFNNTILHLKLFEWINIGAFHADWSIYIDTLTAVMLLAVTYVSALVHVYSIGYMSHDKHKPRFMAYLSLFTFCMLMLVTSDNFLQLFFGWEGVGVCSYLLIGFWFHKKSANDAAIKAFLVNRVGDLGFALGIFFVFWFFGSVEFAQVFPMIPNFTDQKVEFLGIEFDLITITCLLLFMGAMGKSAQLGLHTWLPDAMEGPTPVSALIHAATMVTAGVFMVARCSPIFEYSATALLVVATVGAFTALFAATVALVQNDIKKIIAYSTCSQLGYMFLACGVSAYSAGIFHLLTHAFFKALLFLGAGSVIHAMSDEQDIKKMGGIWKKIPFTYAMMWIGSLALAGIYPFAGFYSKDGILESVAASHNPFALSFYMIGILVAVLTAFYSWRLILYVFHGKQNASKEVMSHIHESPLVMTIPLALLAVGAIGSGALFEKFYEILASDLMFWNNSIIVLSQNNSIANIHNIDHIYGIIPLIAGITGIALAYFLYTGAPKLRNAISDRFKKFRRVLEHKYYFDEFYNSAFVKSAKYIGTLLWKKMDVKFVDGMPNGASMLVGLSARVSTALQSGFIYQYAQIMIAGLMIFIFLTIL